MKKKAAADSTHIRDLVPDAQNARKHNPRNIGTIVDSLHEVGAARSIVIDEDNVILAGNGTVEAAGEAGITKLRIIDAAGDEIIAVRRSGLTKKQKKRLALADNRSAELAEWETGELQRLVDEGEGALDGLFTDQELETLIGGEDDEASAELGNGGAVFSTEQIIETAFNYFRSTGFPYPKVAKHVAMQEINKLAQCDGEALVNTVLGYRVADSYHPHRFSASAKGMKSPLQIFESDASFRKLLDTSVGLGKTISEDLSPASWIPLGGLQQCSNFRPGFALHLYREFCSAGSTVLDTSTGYGGRLVGFIASGVAGKYIGIDPNVPTYEGNLALAADFGFSDAVELINKPAEDVDVSPFRGACDFAFTSPPYFSKEIYSTDATQSCNRYESGEDWRVGFLEPLLRLQFDALKVGAVSCINIADVSVKGARYPLKAWTVEAAKLAGFEHVETRDFKLAKRIGASHEGEKVATEPVLIFRKNGTQKKTSR